MRDWEACYLQGDTPWDKGSGAPPLAELLARMGGGLFGSGPVLVPGCGLGHDVRMLVESGIPALGLDISPTALERARGFPTAGDASYELGDFLQPEWRAGRRFTAIWEHTCFCAIDPAERGAYAESAAAVLPSGGILAGVFYLTPNDPGETVSGPPFNVSIEELDSRFGRSFERIEGWVPRMSYPGREGREWIGIYRKLPEVGIAG